MDPIFLILLAVIVTTILNLAFARQRPATPAARRLIWVLLLAGVVVLLAIAALTLTR